MIRIIENWVAADLRKNEASRPHMKKSRYSQHSYLEDGELLHKIQEEEETLFILLYNSFIYIRIILSNRDLLSNVFQIIN